MKKNTFTLIGLGATILSLLCDLIGEWADDKDLDARIDEKLEERGIKRIDDK